MDPTSYVQVAPNARTMHAALQQKVADLEKDLTERGIPVGPNAKHADRMFYALFSNACKSIRPLSLQAIRDSYNANPTFYPLPYGFVDVLSYKKPSEIMYERAKIRLEIENRTRMISQWVVRESAQSSNSPVHATMHPYYSQLLQLQAKLDAFETSQALYLMQFKPIDMPSYYVSMLPIIDAYEAALSELRAQDFYVARLASASFRSTPQITQIPQLQAYNQVFGQDLPTTQHNDTTTDNTSDPADVDLAVYHLFNVQAALPHGPSS